MRRMRARCPKDKKHKLFVTVATITQDWIVDEEGIFDSFPDDKDERVVHGPTEGNSWTCAECGAEADVGMEEV